MQKKRLVIGLTVALCLCAGGGYYYYRHTVAEQVVMNYVVGTVTKGDIASIISATGTVNPVNYVDVSTNVPGLLEKVLVSENETVEKGQVIAYIDDSSLKESVASAQAIFNNRQAEYERNGKLFAEGVISEQMLDTSKMGYLTAKADLVRAQKSLADATIVAPMSGTIIGTPLKPGQTISTGLSSQMIICTIADLKNMEIFLSIDETDIAKVKVGQRVTFTVDAYTNKVFEGRVQSIAKGKKGNMGVMSNNVVYYTVKVAVPESESASLLPTMTARASIYGEEAKDVLLVPLTAVRNDKNGNFVYVIKNGKPVRQSVEIGLTNETSVQILKGLSNGEEIVVSGDVNKKEPKDNDEGLF